MDLIFPVNGIVAGLILLVISFTGQISGILRVISFAIGLVTVVQVGIILDDVLYEYGSDREGFTSDIQGSLYKSITQQDREVTKGSGVGRVYLRPRVPMIKNGVRVNVRGNPGSKIIYWPMGGNGIGGRNEELELHGVSVQEIRTHALGAGVLVLDEIGKGIAITEEGVRELLFREVDGGVGVNRIKLG